MISVPKLLYLTSEINMLKLHLLRWVPEFLGFMECTIEEWHEKWVLAVLNSMARDIKFQVKLKLKYSYCKICGCAVQEVPEV